MLLSPLRQLAYIGEEFVCAVAVIAQAWNAPSMLLPANSAAVLLKGRASPRRSQAQGL